MLILSLLASPLRTKPLREIYFLHSHPSTLHLHILARFSAMNLNLFLIYCETRMSRRLQRKYTARVEKRRYLKCLYRVGKRGLKSLLLWFFPHWVLNKTFLSANVQRRKKKKVGNTNARCGNIRLWWK